MRVSACHCYDCQQRSGSAFAVQARFPADAVTISGDARPWEKIGDSGDPTIFYFCATCGTTLWYQSPATLALPGQGVPDQPLLAIAVGSFMDKNFPAPAYSVWETRKHGWVDIAGPDIEHFA